MRCRKCGRNMVVARTVTHPDGRPVYYCWACLHFYVRQLGRLRRYYPKEKQV